MVDNVVDKIQKLLAKAEDKACTSEEADAFFSRAQALMMRHAVDMAMVNEARGMTTEREKPVSVRFVYSSTDANIPGRQLILSVIAEANRCQTAYYGGYTRVSEVGPNGVRKRQYNAMIVGFPSDVQFVEMLYVSVMMQALRDAKRQGRKLSCTETTSFLNGYASGIEPLLRKASDTVKTDTSTALVLVSREDEVQDLFSRLTRKSKASRGYRDNNYSASAAGRMAGAKANVSGGRNAAAGSKGALGR